MYPVYYSCRSLIRVPCDAGSLQVFMSRQLKEASCRQGAAIRISAIYGFSWSTRGRCAERICAKKKGGTVGPRGKVFRVQDKGKEIEEGDANVSCRGIFGIRICRHCMPCSERCQRCRGPRLTTPVRYCCRQCSSAGCRWGCCAGAAHGCTRRVG